jgi:hypothetical protein
MRFALAAALLLVACHASKEEKLQEELDRRALITAVWISGQPNHTPQRQLEVEADVRRARAAYVATCERCVSSSACEDEARRVESVGQAAQNDVVCR